MLYFHYNVSKKWYPFFNIFLLIWINFHQIKYNFRSLWPHAFQMIPRSFILNTTWYYAEIKHHRRCRSSRLVFWVFYNLSEVYDEGTFSEMAISKNELRWTIGRGRPSVVSAVTSAIYFDVIDDFFARTFEMKMVALLYL